MPRVDAQLEQARQYTAMAAIMVDLRTRGIQDPLVEGTTAGLEATWRGKASELHPKSLAMETPLSGRDLASAARGFKQAGVDSALVPMVRDYFAGELDQATSEIDEAAKRDDEASKRDIGQYQNMKLTSLILAGVSLSTSIVSYGIDSWIRHSNPEVAQLSTASNRIEAARKSLFHTKPRTENGNEKFAEPAKAQEELRLTDEFTVFIPHDVLSRLHIVRADLEKGFPDPNRRLYGESPLLADARARLTEAKDEIDSLNTAKKAAISTPVEPITNITAALGLALVVAAVASSMKINSLKHSLQRRLSNLVRQKEDIQYAATKL